MKNNQLLRCDLQLSDLPDECQAKIFGFLDSVDRKSCSLVCRRWLRLEGESRDCLSLNTDKPDLITVIPHLFIRFDSITTISLKSDSKAYSNSFSDSTWGPYFDSTWAHGIDDSALVLIALHCRSLTGIKLYSCKFTAAGMADFAVHCKGLKLLLCSSCDFGTMGLNAVLDHCSLEVLFVIRLDGPSMNTPLGPAVAAANSLKNICIHFCKDDSFIFGQLIAASKNLRTLRISSDSGDWNKLFAPTVELANRGGPVPLLRELHIFGFMKKIGDEGLIAIARSCHNLEELVMHGVDVTCVSLSLLAANCKNLERLAVARSTTFGDTEVSCIAAKFMALRIFCIWCCDSVTDHCLKVFSGCCPPTPTLINLRIGRCPNVTQDGSIAIVDRLKADRGDSFAVDVTDQCGLWYLVKPYFAIKPQNMGT